MQIFVLGMHRSGTSALARLLNLMGVHFGGENVGTGRNPENEKGFWERRDVRQLNDTVLFNAGCDWDHLSTFDVNAIPEETKVAYREAAADIVLNMDAHRPWFIKEPRCCVLFPIWRDALEAPICIHIDRNPLEVAHSLKVRNRIPIRAGLALWEFYTTRALEASTGLPRIFTSYEELLQDPSAGVGRLHAALAEIGVPGLRLPQEIELSSYLNPELHKQRKSRTALRATATASQLALYGLLKGTSDADSIAAPPLSEKCLDTLQNYEPGVDLTRRVEQANARQQDHSERNLELQLALKRLELKHSLQSTRDLSVHNQALERKNQKLQIIENSLRTELALMGQQATTREANFNDAASEALSRRANILETIKQWDRQLASQKSSIATLSQLERQLTASIKILLRSRRWHLGNALLAGSGWLLLRRPSKSLADKISVALARHEAKREAHRNLVALQAASIPNLALHITGPLRAIHRLLNSDTGRDSKLAASLLERRLQINQRQRELSDLREHVASLVASANALLHSRRWRLGNSLGSLPYRLLLRAPQATVANSLSKLIQQYNSDQRNTKEDHSRRNRHTREGGAPRNNPPSEERSNSVRNAVEDQQSVALHTLLDKSTSTKPAAHQFADRPMVAFLAATRVDIVVCVHNALDDVKRCLDSVTAKTTVDYRLTVVNDGSNGETTQWLRRRAASSSVIDLIETNGPLGYTRAANRGLRASTAGHVVLLNSDTIVPRLWLETLLECMYSSDGIGVVGPLSNAASWQSVPERFDEGGGWAVNELPPGYNVDEFSELVYVKSMRRFPRVDFVNGFCLMISRKVLDKVGYLDEESFPQGYGEENDYCLRARDAGFELAIADQCYIYHAKSKSFGSSSRDILAANGRVALQGKHGLERIRRGTERLRNSNELAEIRDAVTGGLCATRTAANVRRSASAGPSSNSGSPLHILFVLPVGGGSGGANSVILEVAGMRALGIAAKAATHTQYRDGFRRFYRDYFDSGDYFVFFDSDEDLLAQAESFDVIVATLWSTPALIAPIAKHWPDKTYMYYVQDYEPWFFPNDPDRRVQAADSYTLLPEMALMAKTDWLCRTVRERHGREVYRVAPSLDHIVYHDQTPGFRSKDGAVSVAAMVRPSTPRRAPLRTLRVLRELVSHQPDRVRIKLFGCKTSELRHYIEQNDPEFQIDFNFDNRGVLTRSQVAGLLREADIFLDLSDYQAFGRTGLEAMACGCATVLTAHGGVYEYAVDGENALIVDVTSFEETVQTIERLVEDRPLRERLQTRAIETASRYSAERASLSELSVFRLATLLNKTKRTPLMSAFRRGIEPADGNSVAASISVLLTADSGERAILDRSQFRVLRPLRYLSLRNKLVIREAFSVESLQEQQPDCCVVPSGVLTRLSAAEQTVEICGSAGIKLIYEADDQPATGGDGEVARLLAAKADRVIVSTDSLREPYAMLNRNVCVLPAALDEALWMQDSVEGERRLSERRLRDTTRLLFIGDKCDPPSVMNGWRDAIETAQTPVTLQVFGDFNGNFGAGCEVIPRQEADHEDFVRRLRMNNRWNVAVLPANDCTVDSDLRFLGYSALGLAIVCSDCGAHAALARHGENSIVVGNTRSAWHEGLARAIGDVELQDSLRARALYDVDTKYSLNRRAADYYQAYCGILKS